MRISQQQPTEQSVAGDIARYLLRIMGPAIQAPDGSQNAARFLALGGALARARQITVSSLDEAFVTTALMLLGEHEADYGLAVRPDLSVEARRTRLLAKVRASKRSSPQGILRAVRTIDPTTTIVEITPDDISPRTTDGAFPGSDRDVYFFYVVVDSPVFFDTDKKAQIEAIVHQMKPAHKDFRVVKSIGFLAGISQAGIDSV